MAKVKKNETTDCWEWCGERSPYGYGRFTKEGKKQQVHRISYEIHCGVIPLGMCVCHRCDNRICVNPDHLFIGTHSENSADMVAKGRQVRGTDIPQAKLTEQEVISIRGTHGLSHRKIARMYGVSPSQINDIRLGKWWKHLLPNEEGSK
jgi:hypothetical protein